MNKYPTVMQVEGENPWTTYVKKQVFHKNNCFYGCMVGKPGSGKSWGSLSWACQINPDFKLEGNWYFSASKMFNDIKDFYSLKGPKTPGKLWFLDEAGVALNNLNYYSELNRGFNTFFQTSRHRNPIVMITVPGLRYIDAGVRKIMTAKWTADGYSDGKTHIEPREMQYNEDLDKIYYKRLKVKKLNGTIQLCTRLLLPKPPKHIRDEYEKLKDEFTTDLFSDISENIKQMEDRQAQKRMSNKAFSVCQEQVLSLLKKGFSAQQAADNQEITLKVMYDHIKQLRTKGIGIVPIRDDETHKVSKYIITDPREENSAESI